MASKPISDVTDLNDSSALPYKLSLALAKAKVNELAGRGEKAVPLTVLRCVSETHADGQTFQIVELRTNYDVSKLCGADVDMENYSIVVPKGTPNNVICSVPVVLHQSLSGLKLVFGYICKNNKPRGQWILKNSRGDEAIFIASGESGTFSLLPVRPLARISEPAAEECAPNVPDSIHQCLDGAISVTPVRRKTTRNARRKRQRPVPSCNAPFSQSGPDCDAVDISSRELLDPHMLVPTCGGRATGSESTRASCRVRGGRRAWPCGILTNSISRALSIVEKRSGLFCRSDVCTLRTWLGYPATFLTLPLAMLFLPWRVATASNSGCDLLESKDRVKPCNWREPESDSDEDTADTDVPPSAVSLEVPSSSSAEASPVPTISPSEESSTVGGIGLDGLVESPLTSCASPIDQVSKARKSPLLKEFRSDWQTVASRRRRRPASTMQKCKDNDTCCEACAEGKLTFQSHTPAVSSTADALEEPKGRPHGRVQCEEPELLSDVERDTTGAIEDDGARKLRTGSEQHELIHSGDYEHSASLPDIEKLLRGWQSATCAAEACTEWEGPRIVYGRGQGYWCSRRNENACWRLWYLERVEGKQLYPSWWSQSNYHEHDVCSVCCLGGGFGKICACMPDPYQPLPKVDPDGRDPFSPPINMSNHREIPPLALPPGLEDQTPEPSKPWRQLLRGSHAFSLKGAPTDVSLLPSNPDEALVTRQRFQNAAWRKWWAKQKTTRRHLYLRQEVYRYPPTPPGSPRERCASDDDSQQNFLCAPVAAMPSAPYVLLPVPVHLVTPVQLYADKLQDALEDAVGVQHSAVIPYRSLPF